MNLDLDKLLDAINTRYSVNVHPRDISDCRRTSRAGAITLTFWNTKVDSAFHALTLAMKSPGVNASGKELYANFALTARRNELLWNVRKAWKDKQLQKFYVDVSGAITIVPNDSTRKIRLCSVTLKENDFVLYPLTVSEFKDLLKQHNRA